MMAPRTTTPATIRTPLSSLSELPGWVSPDWIWVSVTRQRYWLPPTTTQSFLRWPASPLLGLEAASGHARYAVEVLDPRQARAAPAPEVAGHGLDLAHHAQDVAAGEPREVVGRPAAVGQRAEQRRVGRDVLQARRAAPRRRRSRRRARCGRCPATSRTCSQCATTSASVAGGWGWSSVHVASKAANRTPSDSGIALLQRRPRPSRGAQSAHAAFTNFGTKVTMHTPPPRGHRLRARRRVRCAGCRSPRGPSCG